MIETALSGLVYSSLLSLMALGITLLYRTTKVPNFAHASFVTLGVYSSYTLYLLKLNPYYGIILGFVISGLAALLLFYAILEPLRRRKASVFMLMMATLTYDITLFGVINIYADYLQTTFKVPARNVFLAAADIDIMGLRGILIIAPIVFVVSLASMYILLYKTYIGVATRAIMENPMLASSMGVNVSLMLALSWFLAGGLAGVAGSLYPMYSAGSPSIGMMLIAIMFCASILGGLEHVWGAPIGGFILGYVQTVLISFLVSYLGLYWITAYQNMIVYLVLAITLLTIPRGVVSLILRR
ncbi:MAG: branched-chain amino acid ABC transporter permease [Sulfolobales archaeon]